MQLILLLTFIAPLVITTPDPVKLDGKITKDEWKDASEHEMKNGGKALIMKKDDVLYVALISQKKIWTHVYLSDGKTVKVMHASAALDDVSYKKENSGWRTGDSFQFVMRDTVYNDQLIAAAEKFYQSHGWVSNNGNMASGKVFEFKIDLTQQPEPQYFACVMSDYQSQFSWFPETLKDDTLLTKLVQGNTPDLLTFNPKQWKKLTDY